MICTMKNKYIIRSRIREVKFREILKYVSTSLMLVAFQEVLILKLQKLQKFVKICKKISIKSVINFAKILESQSQKNVRKLLKCKVKLRLMKAIFEYRFSVLKE